MSVPSRSGSSRELPAAFRSVLAAPARARRLREDERADAAARPA